MKELIKRTIFNSILDKLNHSDNKIIIVYGARQVGKTTLVEEIIDQTDFKTLKINADELKYNDILSSRDLDKMKSLVSGYELLFIDEAQRIENIGLNLKILADGLKDLKIIVTGSSSFDLANKIKEPLTGRVWTYNLYPLSVLELSKKYNSFELDQKLEDLLIFGSYPEVFVTQNLQDKKKLLGEITNSYLYKDVLELDAIKKSDKIYRLLKLIAFQIGQEVSVHELSNSLDLNYKTVEKYLDILEKAFVIYRLPAFSRNLRKEVTKKNKIYFYDLGVRNVLIDNLNFLSDRNDVGALFENFLISERMKKNQYQEKLLNSYFWRIYTGAEIDYVEDGEGKLTTYEFKYSKKQVKQPLAFLESYPESKFELVNRDNYLKFVS